MRNGQERKKMCSKNLLFIESRTSLILNEPEHSAECPSHCFSDDLHDVLFIARSQISHVHDVKARQQNPSSDLLG